MAGLGTRVAKRRAITAEQWLAARLLSEGAPPTRARVAAALGCDVGSLHARAAAELWISADFRPVATKDAWEDFMRIARESARSDVAARHEALRVERAERAARERARLAEAEAAGGDGAGADAGGADAGGMVPAGADAQGGSDAVGSDPLGPDWADNDDVVHDPLSVVARPRRAAAVEDDDGDDEAEGIDEAGDDGDHDPRAMLARGARFLSRRLSRLMRLAERGGAISKQEIDGLAALSRMMDRWDTLARERAANEETDTDERIAEALRRIDRRILALARQEAERLVAARVAQGDRGGHEQGMVR
jgi:hypothetical protein